MLHEKLKDHDLFKQASFIDGEWVSGAPGAGIDVENPASGETIGFVPDLDAGEIRSSIEAASRAFHEWRKKPAEARSAVIRKWGALMLENIDDLALIMTLEQGKPIDEARGEINYAYSFVEWFAEECKRSYGDVIPSPWPDKRILAVKEPIGVVAAITPWNFPTAMVTRKAVPAIAAGCTVILKPAEQTPFSALALGVLAKRAGLPDGVFNVVTGEAEMIGKILCESPVVRKLTFTGSTQVGRILMAQSAQTIKKVGLELGGNAPFIVLEDGDLDDAVEGAIASKYRNAGQTCVCANRFLVQSSVYDQFIEKLAARSQALVVAPGLTKGAQQGPIIDEGSVQKIEKLLENAKNSGARLVTGGTRQAPGSRFFLPTVICDVTNEMAITKEEIFGPVCAVARFETDDEAIQLANDTEYGLAAYFYGQNVKRIWRMMEALEYGIVGVNSGVISTAVAPFGGVKQSGVGREGGRAGLDEFMETKYVCLGGL